MKLTKDGQTKILDDASLLISVLKSQGWVEGEKVESQASEVDEDAYVIAEDEPVSKSWLGKIKETIKGD